MQELKLELDEGGISIERERDKKETETLRIHAIIPVCNSNGPGKRMAIYLQGCTFNCAYCINPETHSIEGGTLMIIEKIYEMIRNAAETYKIEGITFTGGEPLLQVEGVIKVANFARSLNLNVIISTGFEYEEIEASESLWRIYQYADVISAGRYHHEEHLGSPIVGSKNKALIFCSDRFTERDILLSKRVEISFDQSDRSNSVMATGTGINDLMDLKRFF